MEKNLGKIRDDLKSKRRMHIEEEEEETVTDCNGESSAVKVRTVVSSLCCTEACTSPQQPAVFKRLSAPVTIKVTVTPTRMYQMCNTQGAVRVITKV